MYWNIFNAYTDLLYTTWHPSVLVKVLFMAYHALVYYLEKARF
jgi:hypothetical protein